ncbi:hypothetical protein Tco_1316493 [Tanacetum coccineum]
MHHTTMHTGKGAKHDQKLLLAASKKGMEEKKSASTKQPKPKPAIEKSSKPAPAPKPKVTKEKPSKASTAKPPKLKPAKEKSTKATPLQKAGKGKVAKVRNVKSSFQLVDEPDEEPAHSEPEPGPEQEGACEEYDMERADSVMSESIQHSGGDIKILKIAKELGEDVTNQVNLEEKTVELDQDQARSDPVNLLTEVVSVVIVPIYQESSSVPPLSTPVIDLSPPKPASSTTQTPIFTETTTTTTTPLPPPLQQQSTTESELAEHIAALEKKLSNLEQNNKNLDNTTRNLGSRFYTLELRDLPHKINEAARENVKEAVQIDLQAPLRDRFKDLHLWNVHRGMSFSLKRISLPRDPQSSAWKKFDTRDAPSSSSKQQSSPHAEQPVEDIPIQDSDNISDLEDTDSAYLPKTKQRLEWLKPILDDERPATLEPAWVIPTSHIPDAVNNRANALATTYQAPAENSLLEKTGDMRTFMNWYCQKMGKTELTQADLEDQIDWANPEDLDYLRYGNKGSGQALSISKMKAARYHDFGLELLVPEHMWIDDVCTYDISASYGISHWWFNRQKFYIDRHTAKSSRMVVRTHMRILSVVRIKSYSHYGYDYLKEITLRRSDHQEYMIAEKDFKNLYPSDFEDLNLLLLQCHLNNLPGSDICMLSTAVKLWTRNLASSSSMIYTIIDSPRTVVFPVSNNEWKIMQFNEIYKFSDGTLTNIMEALDYRVKEYKVNRLNPGMNTRFWTDKDVERSKEFIHAIERRLKTRRIFRNLECFVGGRVRDIDYRLLQRTE